VVDGRRLPTSPGWPPVYPDSCGTSLSTPAGGLGREFGLANPHTIYGITALGQIFRRQQTTFAKAGQAGNGLRFVPILL